MRLLYLYVYEWIDRGIDSENPLELNFETGFSFRCEKGCLRLRLSRGLPDGFFSTRSLRDANAPKRETVVESISVITGDNGSGKTSVASILHKLFRRGRPSPSYICIFLKGRDLFCYQGQRVNAAAIDCVSATKVAAEAGYRWINVDDDASFAKDCECLSDVKNYEHPFDVIYYSPCLLTRDLWNDEARDGFYDVSTGHYLLGNELIADTRVDLNLPVDKVTRLYLLDRILLLNYAHDYVNLLGGKDKAADLILPLPRYARIAMPMDVLERFRDWYSSERNCEYDKNKIINDNLFSKVINAIEDQQNSDAVAKYISFLVIEAMIRLPPGDIESMKVKALKALMELLFRERNANMQEGHGGLFDVDRSIRCLGINVINLKVLLKKLHEISKPGNIVVGARNLIVNIESKKILDDVIDIIRLSNSIGDGYRRILDVSLADMSSGEMAYWSLFSRLYDSLSEYRIKSRRQTDSYKDVLVFLDEAETTLHPDWQRRIIHSIIWFFERFTKNLRAHIIFATHSPIILSDIPKGNVAFLFRDRKSPSGVLLSSRKSMLSAMDGLHNTFGANIYDMYRMPFYLDNGTTGTFALTKINEALAEVAEVVKSKIACRGMLVNSRQLSDTSETTLALIGDDIIKRYIKGLRDGGLL